MAVIKCKMCGGDLIIEPGSTVAECEFCGSKQTIPNQDNDKKLTLFARANRLRMGSEFDKAAGIYESIVADFPEEAEAYWGLVLCKYGIEYVDDPASGRKIPTCHRSSFDSVMDDKDFEQAMENADVLARRVYREEAKAIEEIRKGIIEVSGKEEPYDIFICYKETAENGDRTIDSVIAQDVYDALTAKGYRVFFSRITLEDKLGQEYEPYIFAALNSAKIMLAFGTDYEYYNAVWVKNEWSRYLKLMAKDKSKHLIPCYKNIDAYDMPKEFAKLQAQDMGKVGAMQDLLRGIEKILPKAAAVQPVLTHRSAMAQREIGNKLSNLLERGNIALEDGNWAKAENFYEDALNNDAHSAEGYIGLLLSKEKCRTLDAFIRKCKDKTEAVNSRTLKLAADTTHIEEMAERHAIPGYLEKGTVAALYDFDLSYSSAVANREQQKAEEAAFWQNQPQLHRAEQYAQGQIAEVIQRAKDDLFGTMNARIKTAQQEEANAIEILKKSYADHIRQADEKAAQLHNDAEVRRESDYQKWLQIAKTETSVSVLKDTAGKFAALGTYKDSANLAMHCHARAEEEQEKIVAANAAAKKAAEQEAAARAKKNKMIAGIVAVAVVAAIAVFMVVTKVVIPNNHYNAAVALMNDGKYTEAIAAFEAMNGYKDSKEQILNCQNAIKDNEYNAAIALMNEGKYEEAISAFSTLDGYKDSEGQIADSERQINDIQYNSAIALMQEGKYEEAISEFLIVEKYRDSEDQIEYCKEIIKQGTYSSAEQLLENGELLEAAKTFYSLGNYSDSWEKCNEVWNLIGRRTVVDSWDKIAIKQDGTLDFSKDSRFSEIGNWKDIVSIGYVDPGTVNNQAIVGLKADGTVCAVGNKNIVSTINGWRDIIAIATSYCGAFGLTNDGTIVAAYLNNDSTHYDFSSWTNIQRITSGTYNVYGLTAEGTVVMAGNDYNGVYSDISKWNSIIDISSSAGHIVGLKNDGTVAAVGLNASGQCNVSLWKNIIAISAGEELTAGLKADGTVVCTQQPSGLHKNSDYNWTAYYSAMDWKDIVEVYASKKNSAIIGLRTDGTAVYAGNYPGVVPNWKDIRISS